MNKKKGLEIEIPRSLYIFPLGIVCYGYGINY